VRTTTADSIMISYDGNETPRSILIQANGKVIVRIDSVPAYIRETGTISRPDVVVDDLWIYPDTARAGDNVWFYARIKNIGNATLSGSLPDTVTFQVDGVTLKRYGTNKQLIPGDTVTLGYSIPFGQTYDWQATYGDHLIRAWADSADRYVELREDNNQAYILKHMKPKSKVVIPGTKYGNGRKFSKVCPVNDTLEANGGTSPYADSMRIKSAFDGAWRPWRKYNPPATWWDTLSTGDGMKWVYAQFKMANGETSATVVDSIILDKTVPVAQITSPPNKSTVSGTITLYGPAYDPYPRHFRLDTLRYFQTQPPHQNDTIHVSFLPVGENPPPPGVLGTWNTTLVNNGWTVETLAVWDSAGNKSCARESLKVSNHQTNGGAGWAADFGTYSSPVMNVATDPSGNVYIAETQNSKVRKYSPRKDSLFAFSAKRGNDSTGLNWAVSMALKDSTTLYVADGYGHCIKTFGRQGDLLLRFGSFGTGQGQFKQPCGIALDHKGRLFVVDRLNHRVQVFSDTSGAFLFQFGSQGQDSGKFNSPTGIAITLKDTLLGIAQDLIWVSDTKNDQIQVFDSLGNYLKTIKQPDSLGFDTPTGICSDKWGDIYVADTKHNRIVELNPYGQRILDFGGLGDSLWQFRTPVGVATSPGAHYLYVADMGNRRVQRFTVILEDSSGGGPQGGAGVQVLPMVYELGPAIPNPSKGQTTFRYALPKESQVNFTIYNVTGQVVREYKPGKQEAGFYTYKWDGRSNQGHKVGAGIYFYRLQAGNWAKTRKMVVIR